MLLDGFLASCGKLEWFTYQSQSRKTEITLSIKNRGNETQGIGCVGKG